MFHATSAKGVKIRYRLIHDRRSCAHACDISSTAHSLGSRIPTELDADSMWMKEAVEFPTADKDKCYEAGKALGDSEDVGEVGSVLRRIRSREAAQ